AMPGPVRLLPQARRFLRAGIVALILLLGAFGGGELADAGSVATPDRDLHPRHLITPTPEEVSVTAEPRALRMRDPRGRRSGGSAPSTTLAPHLPTSPAMLGAPTAPLGPGGLD